MISIESLLWTAPRRSLFLSLGVVLFYHLRVLLILIDIIIVIIIILLFIFILVLILVVALTPLLSLPD